MQTPHQGKGREGLAVGITGLLEYIGTLLCSAVCKAVWGVGKSCVMHYISGVSGAAVRRPRDRERSKDAGWEATDTWGQRTQGDGEEGDTAPAQPKEDASECRRGRARGWVGEHLKYWNVSERVCAAHGCLLWKR